MKRRIRLIVKNENFKKAYTLMEKNGIEHDVKNCNSKATIFSVVITNKKEIEIVNSLMSETSRKII